MPKKNRNSKKRPNRARSAGSLHGVVKRLDELLRAGQMCSNVCYNLAQRDYIPQDDAWSMTKSYKAWDEAVSKVKPLNAALSGANPKH